MSQGNPHRPRRKRGRPQDPARALGLSQGAIRYHGVPCRYGHGGERYVSTGACVACYGRSPVAVVADEFTHLFS